MQNGEEAKPGQRTRELTLNPSALRRARAAITSRNLKLVTVRDLQQWLTNETGVSWNNAPRSAVEREIRRLRNW